MQRVAALAVSIYAAVFAAVANAQTPGETRSWSPVDRFVGEWVGSSVGTPGKGDVVRRYEWVLQDTFLREVNTSVYSPQPQNPKGETHEHWTLFSRDRARKLIVMRQFHSEGFVNQYVLLPDSVTANAFVFVSERFENLPSGWAARERYEFASADEFTETFELAPPGQSFSVYSQTQFRRQQSGAAPR